jgi:hypothetical protein
MQVAATRSPSEEKTYVTVLFGVHRYEGPSISTIMRARSLVSISADLTGRERRGHLGTTSIAPWRAVERRKDFTNPGLLATLEPDQVQSTLGLNVNFLRPVRPGRVVSKDRVVHEHEAKEHDLPLVRQGRA